MKTIPMIFNTEMVKALLDGRKTVTRRPIKMPMRDRDIGCELSPREVSAEIDNGLFLNSPYCIGDLIWVRETFCYSINEDGSTIDSNGNPCLSRDSELFYRASPINGLDATWTPSIHMPKSASRLTLRVTDVRIERVQDITEEQAKAEGAFCSNVNEFHNAASPSYCRAFKNIWNSIYSNWDENPYVWVVEFEVAHKNVDEVRREK
ncbi:ASCH domain-containing protein [Vibrio casei]|uniref:ASCH domain-containing protein n=1 Tax=Vibrio casei TaxID=673372 RepID=A0A368LHG9_9VIBR|nr:ASCH domain-containing protein [Vibrio casei]RCS70138.1 ASCH domain-containing protein [Vibrio casei]SJN24209.1 Phage-related protein [Vibrio casei]